MNIDFYLPIYLAGLWLAVSCLIEVLRPAEKTSVHYLAALESAKLLKDWCTWMTGIATVAIAANGILLRNGTAQHEFAQLSLFAFAAAILLDAWLLGSLPSIISRLTYNAESAANDIYEIPIFSFLPRRFFRLGFIAGVQHLSFVVAIYAFAVSAAGISKTS